MGPRRLAQGVRFCEALIKAHVPPDHMFRSAERCADPAVMRQHMARFHGSADGPSIDPELLIRVLLAGCLMG